MEKKVDVAIIGAGTAGIDAMTEVRNVTDDFVWINGGRLGTTCARVGCMPSKVMIQVAEDFHRRSVLHLEGINGGDDLFLKIFLCQIFIFDNFFINCCCVYHAKRVEKSYI